MTWFLDRDFLAKLDLRAYDAQKIAVRTGLPLEKVTAFFDPARRYWVQSSPDYGWLAGANGERQPTLLFFGKPRLSGLEQEELNAVSFDLKNGEITTRGIPFEGEFEWEPLLQAAERAIGFIHVGNAPVLAFKHPTLWHYAVVPLPFHLHDDIENGEDVDLLRDWIARGNYVVHAGNAYYLNAEGEVESS